MPQASHNKTIATNKATCYRESSVSSTSVIHQQTNKCACSLLLIENADYSPPKQPRSTSCMSLLVPSFKFGSFERRKSAQIELRHSKLFCFTPKQRKQSSFRCWDVTMTVKDHQHPEHLMNEGRNTHHRHKIDILEREVKMLGNMLRNEQDMHEVLKHAQRYSGPDVSIPSFVPPKVKELLAELGEVDDEIALLESKICKLQADLTIEQVLNKELKSGKLQQQGNVTAQTERVSFEAKTQHFIGKAMKGDFTVNSYFSPSGDQIKNHISEGSGSKGRGIESCVSFDLTPKSSSSSTDTDNRSSRQKSLSPNKLSESIMKCLIFIYVRLHRTIRQNELEKSGGCAASRSFRGDPNNVKAIQNMLKESKQQDPYGIFDKEESVRRDIGPYKNLILFGCNSLDLKCLSSASFVPLLKNLRGLFNNLKKVELGSLTKNQKLAFWINMYNACVMHGFLQYGVPSSPDKILSLRNEATLNIGGNFLNAQTIENFILRKPSFSSEKKDVKENGARQLYGLDAHEPNVIFALCCGTRSSPSLRIYTAEGVVTELERSKLEYLQASIMVTSSGKIAIPEQLLKSMNDFVNDQESLIKWLCQQLPISGLLRKSIVDCLRGQNTSAVIEKICYEFEFQYLLANISST